MKNRTIDFMIVLFIFMACAVTLPKEDDRVTYNDVPKWKDQGCNSCHENYKG